MASGPKRIEYSRIATILAESLGDAKAQEVWQEASHRLGVPSSNTYAEEDVVVVLSALAKEPGLVGIAARLAQLRLGQYTTVGSSHPLSAVRANDASSLAPPAVATTFVDLLPFVTPALGEEKGRQVLHQLATSRGLKLDALTRENAVTLLEAAVDTPGLVGVVASFAKVQFFLRYPA